MAFKIKFDNPSKFTADVTNKDSSIKTKADNYIGSLNNDYTKLKNQPSINGVKLIGDKTFEDLGVTNLTKMEILEAVQIAANEVFK